MTNDTTEARGCPVCELAGSSEQPLYWSHGLKTMAHAGNEACIAALRAEVERLRVDAERYRRLRDARPSYRGLWIAMGLPMSPEGVSCWRGDKADAAIDAARGGER